MKILVAPDSFKGSLSAMEICNIVEKAAVDVFKQVKVEKLPVADGGEGTVESLLDALNGISIEILAKDPIGRERMASYGIFKDTNAIIEMAAASGLPLVSGNDRDIMRSNTYGTGQLILDAIQRGCETIYLGIGGSATNDGGIGCMAALGVRFLDESKTELEPLPINFEKIAYVDATNMIPEVANVKFVIMCDVKNPLLGENGATNIYGRQKGASDQQMILLEKGLTNYIKIVEETCKKQVAEIEGAGAAGGLGAGLMAFTDASMRSGVETILEILDFNNKVDWAELVVTGEGKMDHQSACGKVAFGVGSVCKSKGVPCAAIVGGMGEAAEVMFEHGIDTIMTTVNGIMSIDQAISEAEQLCYSAAVRLFRSIAIGKQLQ